MPGDDVTLANAVAAACGRRWQEMVGLGGFGLLSGRAVPPWGSNARTKELPTDRAVGIQCNASTFTRYFTRFAISGELKLLQIELLLPSTVLPTERFKNP